MFAIRNIGGVVLFVLGTTYLWITPMFASEAKRAWTRYAIERGTVTGWKNLTRARRQRRPED